MSGWCGGKARVEPLRWTSSLPAAEGRAGGHGRGHAASCRGGGASRASSACRPRGAALPVHSWRCEETLFTACRPRGAALPGGPGRCDTHARSTRSETVREEGGGWGREGRRLCDVVRHVVHDPHLEVVWRSAKGAREGLAHREGGSPPPRGRSGRGGWAGREACPIPPTAAAGSAARATVAASEAWPRRREELCGGAACRWARRCRWLERGGARLAAEESHRGAVDPRIVRRGRHGLQVLLTLGGPDPRARELPVVDSDVVAPHRPLHLQQRVRRHLAATATRRGRARGCVVSSVPLGSAPVWSGVWSCVWTRVWHHRDCA